MKKPTTISKESVSEYREFPCSIRGLSVGSSPSCPNIRTEPKARILEVLSKIHGDPVLCGASAIKCW